MRWHKKKWYRTGLLQSLLDQFDAGIYVDVVTGEPLFSSKVIWFWLWLAKFQSSISPDVAIYKEDKSFNMTRTEVPEPCEIPIWAMFLPTVPREKGGPSLLHQ